MTEAKQTLKAIGTLYEIKEGDIFEMTGWCVQGFIYTLQRTGEEYINPDKTRLKEVLQ